MRIALLYHQFVVRGGLEGYLREFAGQLRAAGHELVLVASRVDDTLRTLAGEVRLIPPAASSLGTLRRFAERSAAMVPELKTDAVLGFGRTWRQDIHRAGGGCHWHYSRMLPWWKSWRLKNRWELTAERRLYTGGGTRLFVVNSAKVRTELAEAYRVPPERVRIIRTAVHTDRWRPAADDASRTALRASLGMPSGAPALLFASLDHRRKGLDTLLKALARVPGAHLWIAGQKLDAWQGRIRRLGLTDRITGIGRAELRPYFQAADWFVHPTHYDACANTVLQSMACALPGIISTGDGASELIRPRENGLILQNPGDPEELGALLRMAVGLSAEHRIQLGTAARETVCPLTWSAHLAGWMQALEEL
ncbi:MAG: glycosyltransferase family 1 protein [Verrucomicrobiaceae bacterium]|nr:MAG: glycosyltransferase family 1 protein [Verrucomicrobiaceae bacterium]